VENKDAGGRGSGSGGGDACCRASEGAAVKEMDQQAEEALRCSYRRGVSGKGVASSQQVRFSASKVSEMIRSTSGERLRRRRGQAKLGPWCGGQGNERLMHLRAAPHFQSVNGCGRIV
jgi:hypothetical protein